MNKDRNLLVKLGSFKHWGNEGDTKEVFSVLENDIQDYYFIVFQCQCFIVIEEHKHLLTS